MSTTFWIWLAAAVVFLILELISPALFFICFVAGGLVAAAFAYFSPEAYYWQLGIFVGVTLVLLPLTRKMAKRITKPAPQKSNVDALVGKIGLVTKAIDPDLGGQVLIEGETWLAAAGEKIGKQTKVTVDGVSGAKVHVSKVKTGEE